jgi:hypothetical protein
MITDFICTEKGRVFLDVVKKKGKKREKRDIR